MTENDDFAKQVIAAGGFWSFLKTSTGSQIKLFFYPQIQETVFSREWVQANGYKTTPCKAKHINSQWGPIYVDQTVEVPIVFEESYSEFIMRGYVGDAVNAVVADVIVGNDLFKELNITEDH